MWRPKPLPPARPLTDVNQQNDCILFRLPVELRALVWIEALATYEDHTRPNSKDSSCFRPGCTAARRSDAALLRTCKKIYHETRGLPWQLNDQHVWLEDHVRTQLPPVGISKERLKARLADVYDDHGSLKLQHLHVFARVHMLDRIRLSPHSRHSGRGIVYTNTSLLTQTLQLPHLSPVNVTFTVRHTDWIDWSHDAWLRVGYGKGLLRIRLPAATQTFYLELETVTRKFEQLRSVVEQIQAQWRLSRDDGVIMIPAIGETAYWEGSSYLDGWRYVYDETRPSTLSYVVMTLVFKPASDSNTTTEHICDIETLVKPAKLMNAMSIDCRSLERLGISRDVPGDVARQLFDEDGVALIKRLAHELGLGA